jgi:class 3 adenylate cyclase
MKMRRFTLAFEDAELERTYLRSRVRRWSTWAIGGAIYALVFTPLIAWACAALLPDHRLLAITTMGSMGLTVLISLAILRLVPVEARSRAVAVAAPLTTWLVTIAPIAFVAVSGRPIAVYATIPGLSLTINILYSGVGLRFVRGLVVTWSVVALYLLAMVAHAGAMPAETFIYATVWFLCAQLFAMQQGYADERSRRRLFLQQRTIEEERAKSDRLLRNMLPEVIAERLKTMPGAIADGHEAVSVLFADIAGFTPMSAKMSPDELVRLLNEIFSTFDGMAARHGLEKIKTIGDAYMVVGGVSSARPDHATAVAKMALEMRDATARFGLQMRIGAHTGPAVAGVIGTAKYSYDLWGDTVNTASRMESHGAPGRIHITDEFRAALDARWKLEERGVVEIKGKGPMKTWWLDG